MTEMERPTTAEEREGIYRAWGLRNREPWEEERYRDFINAQAERNRLLMEFQAAELRLQGALMALDDESAPRQPAVAAERPTPDLHRVFVALRAAVEAFSTKMGATYRD